MCPDPSRAVDQTRRGLQGSAAFAVIALLCAAALAQQPVASVGHLIDPGPPTPPPRGTLPSERYGVTIDPQRNPWVLDAVDNGALLAEDAAKPSLPLRNGVGLSVDEAADSPFVVVEDIPKVGTLRYLVVRSPGAEAVRLHFADVRVAPGAELWVYSADLPQYRQAIFEGLGPFGNGEFWSTVLPGDTAVVEYLATPGLGGGWFRIDGAMHIYRPLFEPVHGDDATRGTCHNDVMCFPEWHPLHNATARITFITDFGSFLCSATLLNTEAGDRTPYLMTANHCISTDAEAQTLTAFWFYQKVSCGGANASSPTSDVADMLDSNAQVDWTLLMVEGALPSGLTWAGWTTDAIPDGVEVAGIHHPGGARKKISFGAKIRHPFGDPSNYHGVTWTSGTIQGGSSGSGLYRASDQLYIGVASHSEAPAGCDNADGPSGYGKFRNAQPVIANLLAAGSDDALEDDDTCATARAAEPGVLPGQIIKSVDEDWFRIRLGPGSDLTATLAHANAWGDVDMELHAGCGGPVVAVRAGGADVKTLTYTNAGATGDFYLRIFLGSDTRNSYALDLAFTPVCLGDLDGNGTVELDDLSILLHNFGSTSATPDQGDLDGDGRVVLADLALLLWAFGNTC